MNIASRLLVRVEYADVALPTTMTAHSETIPIAAMLLRFIPVLPSYGVGNQSCSLDPVRAFFHADKNSSCFRFPTMSAFMSERFQCGSQGVRESFAEMNRAIRIRWCMGCMLIAHLRPAHPAHLLP
jgi:hypothetical protein